ncbi:MAG: hypothetical protein KDK08_22520 [Rhizobiaceae bacterium]|nr:hypothetical protein [Rhizobiaceae bacterium]
MQDTIGHARSLVAQGDIGPGLDRQIASIERAIDRLRSLGANEAQIGSLEGQLAQIRGEAMGAMRNEAEFGKARKAAGEKATSGEKVIGTFKDGASEKSAARARDVLTKTGHWAHEAFRQELFRVVEATGRIPEKYKETLARDAARLLEVCPKAGGLVTAMVTRGQPRGSFARRLATKGNDAVGAAYEIMGTAALCEKVSRPSNTKHKAPDLHIDPTKDKLVFGPKAYMNHRYAHDRRVADRSRKTTEADAQFFREGREIGIDFKHVKEAGTRSSSKDLINQIDAVKEQIKAGQYAEFHFVTNGKFSPDLVEAVDAANDELLSLERRETEDVVREGVISRKSATGDGLAKIALHEHVNSIVDDPFSDGEVT